MKARDEEEVVRNYRRAQRVAEIRSELGMTGEEFAEELTREARRRNLPWRYDRSEISRFERGSRAIMLDDALLIVTLDPRQRGLEWFVTGHEHREPRERPSPIPAPVVGRRPAGRKLRDGADARRRDSA